MTQTPRFLTTSQVAEHLGVSVHTVTSWCRAGAIKAIRTPSLKGLGNYRIPVSEVERITAEPLPEPSGDPEPEPVRRAA